MHTLARHIEAPNGYRDLQKGINYVYLGPAALSGRVLLCSFEPKRQRVHLYFPKRKHFEFGLKSRKIIESKRQHNYPAWLTATLQKESDPSLYGSITNYKLRHKKRVKKRYKRIKPLLKQAKTIFATADPSKPVKAYARRNSLNELRTCFDFFAVVAHAGSRWALLPLYDGNGTYERNIKKTSSRVGRKSQKHGADYGYPRTHKMNQKIYTGYDKYSGPGVSQKDIWRFTLVNVFGCQARMPDPTSRVQYEFFHPKGKPYPTWSQFRRAIETNYGRDRLRRDKLGDQKVRNKNRPSKGSYSAEVSNLMEKIEADGYFLPEVPRGERDGHPMPPIVCVRIRDVVSGLLVGIGFSIGGETADAYRNALFCMAIKKSEYGRLIGLDIDDEEWPSHGLPSWIVVDRGPGAAKNLLRELTKTVTFRSLAESYSGQSKAVAESANPKNTEVSGGPMFRQSHLTYTQLIKREILRSCSDNAVMDVSSRLTNEMITDSVPGKPLAIYDYLDRLLRNVSQPVALVDATRAFLKPIQVKLTKDGAEIHKQRYGSGALSDSGLPERAVRNGVFEVDGYCLPLCVRQIWVESNNKLVECGAQMAIGDDDRQLFVTLFDLQELERLRKLTAQGDTESRAAALASFEARFLKVTGMDWTAGNNKQGRKPKKTEDARQEFGDTKNVLTGSF